MMPRRLFAAFWLALALVVGQQAAALHDLSHASGQLSQKGKLGHHSCDQCFLSAQLSGAMRTAVAVAPFVPPALEPLPAFADRIAPAASHFPFRSRAPPFLA